MLVEADLRGNQRHLATRYHARADHQRRSAAKTGHAATQTAADDLRDHAENRHDRNEHNHLRIIHACGLQADAHEKHRHEQRVSNRLDIPVRVLRVIAVADRDAGEKRAHRVAQPGQIRRPRHRQADDHGHHRDAGRRLQHASQRHQRRRHPNHHHGGRHKEQHLLEQNQTQPCHVHAAGVDERAHHGQQDHADHIVSHGRAENRHAFLRIKQSGFLQHRHGNRHGRGGEHHADERSRNRLEAKQQAHSTHHRHGEHHAHARDDDRRLRIFLQQLQVAADTAQKHEDDDAEVAEQ